MRLFGLEMETVAMIVAIVAIGKPLFGIIKCTAAAVLFAYIYQRASAGRMPNYAPFWLSSVSGHPLARRYLPFLAPLMSKTWRACGLPESPSVVDRYEP